MTVIPLQKAEFSAGQAQQVNETDYDWRQVVCSAWLHAEHCELAGEAVVGKRQSHASTVGLKFDLHRQLKHRAKSLIGVGAWFLLGLPFWVVR